MVNKKWFINFTKMKKGQIGIEYLMIVGFITLAISSTLLLSSFYMGNSKTKIKINQIENFADKVTSSAESVYYSGEPSKTTISTFLPEGIKTLKIKGNLIIMEYSTSTGDSKRVFESNVPLNGTIDPGKGTKRLVIEAKEDSVQIKKAD